jgi:hypothetical protein
MIFVIGDAVRLDLKNFLGQSANPSHGDIQQDFQLMPKSSRLTAGILSKAIISASFN